jgi:hypothetical protein
MRVTVYNPGAPNKDRTMAKRRRAKKAHKKNPRRARAKRGTAHLFKRKRARRSNPSPKRHYGRKHTKRASHRTRRNPSHNRHHARRRTHRRNPGSRRERGMHPVMSAALAVMLSLVVGVLEGVAPALVISKDFTLQQRVRMGLGAVGTVGGLFLTRKRPGLGLAIAIPSFAVLASATLNSWITKLLAPSPQASVSASVSPSSSGQSGLVRQLGALLDRSGRPSGITPLAGAYTRRDGPPQLGAVYAQDMGAVYAQDMGAVYGMGAPPTGAPWDTTTPFG